MAKKKQFSFDPVASDKPDITDVLTAELTGPSGNTDPFWISSKQVTDIQSSPLNDYETERLTACERVINEGKQAFIDVATALLEINQNKLYRATYKTFEEYCQQKFQFSRSRAYQLIDMAEVAQTLGPGTSSTDSATDGEQPTQQISMFPETASHFTALKEVSPGKRKEVWEAVVSDSRKSGKNITARQIEKANERLTGKAAKNKSMSKSKSEKSADDDFSEYQLELTNNAPVVDETEQPVPEAIQKAGGTEQEKTANEVEGKLDRNKLIDQLRAVIKRSKNHQILITISGAFIIGNGLSTIWCQLRNIPVEEINDSFSDLITYEQAHELGII